MGIDVVVAETLKNNGNKIPDFYNSPNELIINR